MTIARKKPEIIRLIKEGFTAPEIAAMVSTADRYVRKVATREGLTVASALGRVRDGDLVDEQRKKAEALFSQGGTHASIAAALGIPEGTSKRWVHESRRANLLSKAAQELSDEEVSQQVEHERQLESLRRENRILRQKYNAAIKGGSAQDELLTIMERYASDFPTPKFRPDQVRNPKLAKIDETLVLLLSDLHVGETIQPSVLHGGNRYDIDVFLARMELLYEKLVGIAFGALQGYQFEELVIYSLGDLVNGMYGVMHDELITTQAAHIGEVTFGLAFVLAQFIAKLLQRFQTIRFVAVPGNHGRMSRKPTAKNPELNWDVIVPQILSMQFKGDKRVKFSIPDSFFFVDDVRHNRFVGLHGHQVKGHSGIPYYGIQRALGGLTEMVDSMSLRALQQRIDGGDDDIDLSTDLRTLRVNHVVMGHFHQEAKFDRLDGEIIMAPCMKGSDEFSLSSGYRPNRAGQTLFGVHADHGITHRWRIDLQDAYEPKGEFLWWPGGTLAESFAGVAA